MALKGYRWDVSSSVDHKKKDMLDELDDYLSSAHRFIEEAEQQIRDEPQTPPEPPPTAPTTPLNRNERFPRWSYSSLNSAARKKRINGSWEREHCGATNSLKALLDSLDIPSEDCPEPQESIHDNHTMNIKEIEKMTRDLLEGLDDIGETMPVSESKPSPVTVNPTPSASLVPPVQGVETRKIAPPATLAFPSPLARFARKHLNRTLSSETGDEFSTFLEELCDQGVASPSWHFERRRHRSVGSLSDSDREDSATQPTRLWTSEENVSDKSDKSLVSSRQARVHETPSPASAPSFETPLDKQGLLAALTKIGEHKEKLFPPTPPPPLPPVASARNPKLILSDEDIFAEFEAEFSATLTRKSRKVFSGGKSTNSGSRSEISPKTDSRVPTEQKPAVSRKPSNVQLRADFFAGMVNGDPPATATATTLETSMPTVATRRATTAAASKTQATPIIINDGITTRTEHDLKEKAREKVQLEAMNHPLLISYRSAIQKNTAVLQSNPDLSQIISNARGENRKSLIIPTGKEVKDQLPHNCRVIPDRRVKEKNSRNIAANDSNNNSVPPKPPTCAVVHPVRLDDEQSDPYSEEFERSMDSLETFSEKFQLDTISAGFEAELAKLFPSSKRSESESESKEQHRDETATVTAADATETKKSKVSPQKASNGSFLGHGGRRSDEKPLSPVRKGANPGKFSPRNKSSVRHQSDALPRLPNIPTAQNGLRPESPDLAMFELNKSEQILAQLVKSSTDPAVAKLLLGDDTPKIKSSIRKLAPPNNAAFCPCGKLLESAEEARSELCKHCSSSKAMRFLQACTNYGNKTNSLPILRGTPQPVSSSEVRLREKPVRPSKQKRSCRIEFPLTNGCSEVPFSSNSSTSCTARNGPESNNYILRSNSTTDLHEAEAIQALEWLRDTGFPQYAQQFEDNMFPLDMSTVQRDHERLGEDEMQSLIRRLECLNKCASMRAETKAKVAHHCSDEDLALSENWQFHRPSRRWSRIATNDLPLITKQDVDEEGREDREDAIKPEPYSSHDSVFLTPNNRSPDSESHHPASLVANSSLSVSDERLQEQPNRSPTPSSQQTKLRRSGSERIRDAIVRKVDSFRRRRREARSKSPRSLRGNQSGLVGQGSPKFLSPKGKRRECYDNQGLQGDSDVGDLESVSPVINNESVVAERNGELRRDSGVGSCVTRTSVCSTEGSGLLAATKWHCYPGTPVHTLALTSNELVPLWRLTASDHMLLRKHALLRLTAIMERHCPPYKTGWTWTVPKFIKKMTSPSYKDKVLFGIPLMINVQRGGQPIPPCIQFAMQYIASKAPSCYGIFRKPGLKSRIDNLRAIHEQRVMNPSLAMYENQILFDIADMLKQYFREIPDGGLLTTKLAPTFRYIFMHIPEEYRLEAVQCLVTIMPDENREALEALLCFLAELSQYGAANGMTASNLATCFAPSIFQCTQNFSPKRGRRDSTNGDREINENIASNDCLLKMIEWHEELFCASEQTLHSLRIVVEEPSDIRNYLADNGQPLYKLNFEVSLNWLLHEVRNSKGWTQISHPNLELACKRIEDDFHYVRLWKISVQVPASPTRILNRILFERALWDFSLVKQIFVCKLDSETEVCGIIQTEMGKNARRQYLLLRAWKTNITTKGACALIEVSVSDPLLSGNIDPDPEHCHTSTPWVRAHVLASRYLIQPTGSGRSKVTHLARVEPMGRNGYWHSRSAGFVYALQLHNLAQSFGTTVSTESIPSSSGSSATLAANRESVV